MKSHPLFLSDSLKSAAIGNDHRGLDVKISGTTQSHHLESPPCLGWNLPKGFQSTVLSSEVSSCCLCPEVVIYAGKSLTFIKKK